MERRYQQRRSCYDPRGEEKKQPASGSGRPDEKKQPTPCSGTREACPRQEKTAPPPPPCKGPGVHAGQNYGSTFSMGTLPVPLAGLLSGNLSGDLMALMILLLLLLEGKEDARGTVLTLLIFLLL